MLVKTKFSIRDLENLSGIKAHTIRIWEKRYAVLQPSRTDTNIRHYDLDNLKRLLNVTFLYNHGYKISKIAVLDKNALCSLVSEIAKTNDAAHSINTFKMAMFQFNQQLFAETYHQLLKNHTFPEVFQEVFVPLLIELGILWQTGTIDPCHERFVSEMIKQKIVLNIEQQYEENILQEPPTVALFLPYREIHDIGLMYANYTCICYGINTIYLGGNISIHSLKEVLKHHENIVFLTYLTVEPSHQSIMDFCEEYNLRIGTKQKNPLWLMGSKTKNQDVKKLPKNITLIKSVAELNENLKVLKNSQS